jgi:Zn-dependent metalloprotease
MPTPFLNVALHVSQLPESRLRALGILDSARALGAPRVAFTSDEAAARYFLAHVFDADERQAIRGLTAPERPEVMPDLRMQQVVDVPQTATRLVKFSQIQSTIPVFGSNVVVEIDEQRNLVSVDADVAASIDVSPRASLSPADALARVAALARVGADVLDGVPSPTLVFFHYDATETWHLAYFVQQVPAAPPGFIEAAADRKSAGHGLGDAFRLRHPSVNYLIDAHDGSVLSYYSATAMLDDIPTLCHGVDENGETQSFYGWATGTAFHLWDSLRAIKTFDGQGKVVSEILDAFPDAPFANSAADFRLTNRAAVSAHVNAMRVFDFYSNVLKRHSIDNRGMILTSVVNCTDPADEPPPQWHNAFWWKGRMWYGQRIVPSSGDPQGRLVSFSEMLDVIAHELTHGVTEATSNLVYKDESGALNESFSDIFGVIINNFVTRGPDSSVAGWNWEIGHDLQGPGKPLRDMSNPARTGDPDHYRQYLRTRSDNGGVHTNSNIHNKVAYNVLTAKDADGEYVFKPSEAAVLYYLCLTRLPSLATFSKTLRTLLMVAQTYYAGSPQDCGRKLAALTAAYGAVGIQ